MALTATDVYLSQLLGNDQYGGTEEALLGAFEDGTTAGTTLTKAGALFTTLGITEGKTRVYIIAGSVGAAAGHYTVITITDDSNLVLDSVPGNSAGDVDFNVGGPLKGAADLNGLVATLDNIWIKNDGVYAPGAKWDLDKDVQVCGYNSVIKDAGIAEISFATVTGSHGVEPGGNYTFLAHLKITGAVNKLALNHDAGALYMDDVELVGAAGSTTLCDIFVFNDTEECHLRNVWVSGPAGSSSGIGFSINCDECFLENCGALCTADGTEFIGFDVATGVGHLRNCISDAQDHASQGDGFKGTYYANRCTARNMAGDGFGAANGVAHRCVSYGNTGDNYDSTVLQLETNSESLPYEVAVGNEESIELYRNDTPTLVLTVTDGDDVAIPLTGMELELVLRRAVEDQSTIFLKTDTDFDKTDEDLGIVKVDLGPTGIDELASGAPLELEGSFGGRIRTLLRASVTIIADTVR